jgi:hypothetical protein
MASIAMSFKWLLLSSPKAVFFAESDASFMAHPPFQGF